jgi:hypothetical protein
MNPDRKKPGVAFWAAVTVVVALVYPLSFGPACWITSWTNCGARIIPVAYRPITRCLSSCATLDPPIRWFSNLGAARGWGWSMTGGSDLLMTDGPGEWEWRWGPTDIFF